MTDAEPRTSCCGRLFSQRVSPARQGSFIVTMCFPLPSVPSQSPTPDRSSTNTSSTSGWRWSIAVVCSRPACGTDFHVHGFLRTLRRSVGKANYKQLHATMGLLQATSIKVIFADQTKSGYRGQLVRDFVFSDELCRWQVTLNPDIAELFAPNDHASAAYRRWPRPWREFPREVAAWVLLEPREAVPHRREAAV